jgi:DNA-directed RNA polymerase specialized sigma24 family protein
VSQPDEPQSAGSYPLEPFNPALFLTGEYRHTLEREARRRAPNGVDPEDIMMDAIVAALEKPYLAGLEPSQIHQFLITTVKNKCWHGYRAEPRNQRRVRLLIVELSASQVGEQPEIDIDALLDQFGPRLSLGERQLLKWSAEGWSEAAMAAATQISIEALESRLRRARSAARRAAAELSD